MTDIDEAGGSQSQLGRAHAYLNFLADQEREEAGCPDRLVMMDDDGGGAGADTDATNDTTPRLALMRERRWDLPSQ